MCSCLDSPDGRNRSTRLRLIKLVFLILFILASSQLFALCYHFIRLLCYLVLDPHQFPPKPLPKRTSLFGFDLLKFDSHINDDASLLHVAQAVFASVCAILFGTLGSNGICREQTRVLRVTSIILSIVVFITAFGSLSFPGMTPIKQVIIHLLGGSVAVATMVSFSCIFPPKEPDYNYRFQRYNA